MVDGGENIEQVQIRVIEKDKKNSNLDGKIFVHKVLCILSFQHLIVFGLALFNFQSEKFHDWILVNAWIWHVITYVLLVLYVCLIVCNSCRRKTPGNYIVCTILPVIFFVVFAHLSSTQTLLITTALSLSTNIGLLLFLCQSFSQISSTSLSIAAAVITGCSLPLIYHFWTLDDLSLIAVPPCINLTFWAYTSCALMYIIEYQRQLHVSSEECAFVVTALYIDIIPILLSLYLKSNKLARLLTCHQRMETV